MPTPIPAEVLRIVRAQLRDLERVAPRHRRLLLETARAARARFEALVRSHSPGTRTAQLRRVLLLQARTVVAAWERDLGETLEDIGRVAAKVGRDRLGEQIEAWDTVAPGQIRLSAPVGQAAALLDDGLLEWYRTSRERYGSIMISRMRGVLARGVINGETAEQTWTRMAQQLGLKQSWAERIVRTEHSQAMHRRQLLDMQDAVRGEEDEWRKELVAVFDDRTGDDSRFVHGQTRRLDEPFRDNAGRVYMHPPNRPNDRETVVFVPV